MIKSLLKKIDKLIELLLEERECRRSKEVEKQLVDYTKKKNESIVLPPMESSLESGDRKVKTKARILVPEGLSESEKILLEDFYND